MEAWFVRTYRWKLVRIRLVEAEAESIHYTFLQLLQNVRIMQLIYAACGFVGDFCGKNK